jgi:ABC-2 type transport system permease protein
VTRARRIGAEARAAGTAFLRRRTAVFFTFFFPVLLIAVFAGLVRTDAGGGLFARPTGYYVPGYLAVVVLFTPLSRLSSEVARHREGNRFEKLATTPLARAEWLAAHVLVTALLVGAACVVLVAALLAMGADFDLSWLLLPFVALAAALFGGVGALLGRLADSQDGAISLSNGVALPLLFLSETFVSPDLFPAWFRPLTVLSPLTHFARGVRAATYSGGDPWVPLATLTALTALALAVGAVAVPRTEGQ